jgi:hypothetical protein
MISSYLKLSRHILLTKKQRELIKLLDTEPDDYNREIDGKESGLRKEIAKLEEEIKISINNTYKGTIPLSKEWENEIILTDWEHLPADKYKDDSEWRVPNKNDLISVGYYPKNFVEWIRLSETLDSNLNDWICERITTDDLYKYWNKNIRQ